MHTHVITYSMYLTTYTVVIFMCICANMHICLCMYMQYFYTHAHFIYMQYFLLYFLGIFLFSPKPWFSKHFENQFF